MHNRGPTLYIYPGGTHQQLVGKYICIYIYMCVHITGGPPHDDVCVHISICVCVYIYIYPGAHTSNWWVNIYVYIYICVCTQPGAHTVMMCVCIYLYISGGPHQQLVGK